MQCQRQSTRVCGRVRVCRSPACLPWLPRLPWALLRRLTVAPRRCALTRTRSHPLSSLVSRVATSQSLTRAQVKSARSALAPPPKSTPVQPDQIQSNLSLQSLVILCHAHCVRACGAFKPALTPRSAALTLMHSQLTRVRLGRGAIWARTSMDNVVRYSSPRMNESCPIAKHCFVPSPRPSNQSQSLSDVSPCVGGRRVSRCRCLSVPLAPRPSCTPLHCADAEPARAGWRMGGGARAG